MAELAYIVRRSARAKRIRVTVDPAGLVTVVLPNRAPAKQAAAAVKELTPWIARRLADVERQQAQLAQRGDTVPYLGRDLQLEPEAGRTQIRRVRDTLRVPADPEVRAQALERWYRRRAAVEIKTRLDRATAEAGLSYTKLTIRNHKTRWASCSPSGAMSFNWRLLLAPEAVLDYVIWHEVCHLVHMDHSPRFWGLLARYRPGYAEQRRWLRANGGTLVL